MILESSIKFATKKAFDVLPFPVLGLVKDIVADQMIAKPAPDSAAIEQAGQFAFASEEQILAVQKKIDDNAGYFASSFRDVRGRTMSNGSRPRPSWSTRCSASMPRRCPSARRSPR
jgi:hypothetical protein